MQRRMFLKLSGSGLAAAVLTPTSLMMTGCSLKGDAQDVLDTIEAVYAADPTASWAPDLQIVINDMKAAIADWDGTSVNCELQSAITIAGTILDSIPLGQEIDLIVTIALAGINVLLADIAPCSTTSIQAKLSHPYSGHYHSVTQAYRQYYDQFKSAAKWHVGSDIKSAFNRAAKTSGVAETK